MEQYDNKLIYHYTSSSGLLGILSSESLWFTDFSVLNDESEGKGISVDFYGSYDAGNGWCGNNRRTSKV